MRILADKVGFEPTSPRLTAECITVMLLAKTHHPFLARRYLPNRFTSGRITWWTERESNPSLAVCKTAVLPIDTISPYLV